MPNAKSGRGTNKSEIRLIAAVISTDDLSQMKNEV
jgi:hypothetical protein